MAMACFVLDVSRASMTYNSKGVLLMCKFISHIKFNFKIQNVQGTFY